MDTIDLVEIRKQLHGYKRTGKRTLLSLLQVLSENSLNPSQVLGSKIHKTLKTLASLDRQSLPQHEYTDDDVNHIREKSRELHAKFRKMSENESIRKETDNNRKLSAVSEGKSESQQRQVQMQTQTQQLAQAPTQAIQSKTDWNSVDALVDYLDLPAGFIDQRKKVIHHLITLFLADFQRPEKITNQDIAKFVRQLEEAINKKNKESNYKLAIREAIKFIKNDTDSSVRTRMLLGLIDPQTAALMRSEDWTCQQKMKEATKQGRESIKANDLLHNKKIAQTINQDTPLNPCGNCGKKSLRLVNEIQTRASDEPTTKQWECLECGAAETTNG